MMKLKNIKNHSLVVTLCLAAFVAMAVPTLAQQSTCQTSGQGYCLEVGIPGISTSQPVDLKGYISGMFKFGLAVVGITALASIMIGGVRYMISDLVTTKQDAKDQITSAIYGILLLLFSYLILNTINPELVSLAPPSTSSLQQNPSPGNQNQPPQPPTPKSNNTDAQERAKLTQASGGKITFNANPPKTSLAGLQPTTEQGVLSLQNSCGCSMQINAGTEAGHAAGTYSHANGYKLDLATPNSALDQTIYNRIGNSSPTANKNYPGNDGNIYRYENNHWDVCFQCKTGIQGD